jgi:alpha,alpha-trehalase
MKASVAAMLAAWVCVASAQTPVPAPTRAPAPPEVLFKDLFVAVQSAPLFADSKAFVDAVPKVSPETILAEYHAARPATAAALKEFVNAHFTLPAENESPASMPQHTSLIDHIDGLWTVLTRDTPSVPSYSSAIALPHPYVVPGGRFREMYYWDSYFTMLGLEQSGRKELTAGMVDDFSSLLDRFGRIPNGTRTYYLSRSQPPFFFEMVGLLSEQDRAAAFAKYLPQLRREYAFWMDGETGLRAGHARRHVVAMPDGSVLNRYWDERSTPRGEAYREDVELARSSHRDAAQLYRDIRAAAESGWDFGSRWFADGRTRASIDTTQIVPIDLNSLLYGLEQAIELGCERSGDRSCAQEFTDRAAARHRSIDRYLWSPRAGFYFDYQWKQRRRSHAITAASLYPLFVALASSSQAAAVSKGARRDLLKAGGIVTTTSDTGQQWDAPNGWAPLQWIAISGLRRYAQDRLAETIACRWIVNVRAVYAQSGKLVEKYDVVTTGRSGGGGEYPLQDGFGWTNGVTRKLLALYSADCPTP